MTDHDVQHYVVPAVAALLAGAMNSMAGGGSFLSFPALLGAGIPPVNANATNTVALWPGQIAALFAFRSELRAGRALLLPVAAAGALGGVAGAFTLLHTAQSTFQQLIPWLLAFATLLFAMGEPALRLLRRKPSVGAVDEGSLSFRLTVFCWLVSVSFYIGYFGAGAGFLVITVLSLAGIKNLNEVNALKVVCTSLANGLAVVTFIAAGAVYWRECLLMTILAALGGYLGAAYSRKLNPRILRQVVIVLGAALSIYYFYRVYR